MQASLVKNHSDVDLTSKTKHSDPEETEMKTEDSERSEHSNPEEIEIAIPHLKETVMRETILHQIEENPEMMMRLSNLFLMKEQR